MKPPLPPFTAESAKAKVQAAEDARSINDLPIAAADRKFLWERKK